MRYLLIIVIGNLSLMGQLLLAQEQGSDDQEVINVENLYKNNSAPVMPTAPNSSAPISQQEQREQEEIKNNMDVQNSKIKSLTDLNRLAPFRDVSVIQKKFLPKRKDFNSMWLED